MTPVSPHVTVQERKPIRGSLIWWLRLLGVIAFVVLLITLPKFQNVHISRINLGWLVICMLLAVAQLLLDAGIWQWLMSSQHIRQSYPKTVQSYLASQYLGLITPGRVGEFLAAGYVSMNTGITVGYALSSVVMRKALVWIIIVANGLWGLPLIVPLVTVRHGVKAIGLWAAAAAVVFLVGITIWVLSLRRLAKKWERLSPWQIDMTEFWAGIRELMSIRLIVPLALSAGSFALLVFQLVAVLRAIGLVLPIVLVSQIVGISRFVGRLIPVSLSGFGTKDAAVIWLLGQQGIAQPVSLTAVLLLLICTYLITLLSSALSWLIRPLVVRRAQFASS